MSDYKTAEASLVASIVAGKREVSNRKTLGPMVPIQLFQALRLIGMGSSIEAMVGDGARALVYQSGYRVGQILGGAVAPAAAKDLGKFVQLVRDLCIHLAIGQVVLEKADNAAGRVTLIVDECVSCAGISGVKAPLCNFEAGLVGGIVQKFVERPVKAIETRCNAVGDRTCGVDVDILG